MPGQHQVVDHIIEHLARTAADYIFGVDGANIEAERSRLSPRAYRVSGDPRRWEWPG